MRNLLLLLLFISSTLTFCLSDRDGMPRIVAVNYDMIVYHLRKCIIHADWPRFFKYRNYFPMLDPEAELDPLIEYCKDHYGAVKTVEKLHNDRIKAHLDQMKRTIKSREEAVKLNREAVHGTESGDEADAELTEEEEEAHRSVRITKSYRPIQAEFISEERQRLRALFWWQRRQQQADDREHALEILFASQCPNVWQHVTDMEEAIAALRNKSPEAVQTYIAQQRETTQNIGKMLVAVKEETWEQRWWRRGEQTGYRYFRRESPAPGALDNGDHANNNNNNNDGEEEGISCTIL